MDTDRPMISGEALDQLLLKLGRPPAQVVMSVDDFRAASMRMQCFDAWCYPEKCEGMYAGLVAWADVTRDPVIFMAWEWIQVHGNAVGMHDPTALVSNVNLVDSGGRKVERFKLQTVTVSTAHAWEWWTTVNPSRLSLSTTAK